jgi:hypothetical protein
VVCSLVWPGKGRLFYCAVHGRKAVAVLNALGVVLASVDLEIVDDIETAEAAAKRS